MHIKKCKTCGKDFTTKRSHTSFCSRICYRRHPEIKMKYCDRTNEYQKKHSKDPNRRFKKLQYKCKHEKRLLLISKDQFLNLISKNCIYCNKSLLAETGCGLDRLDNNKDYGHDNVVPCCGVCNQIRNRHLTHEEMKIAMSAVIKYRKQL